MTAASGYGGSVPTSGNCQFCGSPTIGIRPVCLNCGAGAVSAVITTTLSGPSTHAIGSGGWDGGPPPDPQVPDTLGWRCWRWDHAKRVLVSPSQGTEWPTAHLDAIQWDTQAVLRGKAGIHARLVPKKWREQAWGESSIVVADDGALVVGIVERFGRYVLGTIGWRAERVVIRELLAPSTDVGLLIEQAYPDVTVHYKDQGDDPWTSAKSSASASGGQPTSPSPSPPVRAATTLMWGHAIQRTSSPFFLPGASQSPPARPPINPNPTPLLIDTLRSPPNSSPPDDLIDVTDQDAAKQRRRVHSVDYWFWWCAPLLFLFLIDRLLS